MKNEVMKILRDSGMVDDFVKTNNRAIKVTREKNGLKNWKPEDFAVELAARLNLEVELTPKNEKLLDAFVEYANELALQEIAKELVKIANDNMEVE